MRILLVTPYFPPQNAVASLRTHAFATEWHRAGEQVSVLTTAKRDDQRGLDLATDGIHVVELSFAVPRLLERARRSHKGSTNGAVDSLKQNDKEQDLPHRSPSRLARFKERTGVFSSVRMPDLTDFWVKPAIAWAREHASPPWDVVVSSSGPYTAHLVARAVKKDGLARAWVADFRDLWTDNHAHCGLIPFVFRERQLERVCLREADAIVTATDGLAKRLRQKSGREVEVIYNGFDRNSFPATPADRLLPHNGPVRIVYTGTLYSNGQDVSPLLGAIARIRRDQPQLSQQLVLRIAGQGQSEWREAATRFGVIDMVELQGMVSRPSALQMQRDADALLLLDWRDRADGVLTAKVFEYLAATAPVLVVGPNRESEALHLVQRTGRGNYAGGNEVEVAQTLTKFLTDANSLRSTPDHEAIEELSRERQSMRLLRFMRRMTIAPGAV